MSTTTTYRAKPGEIKADWFIVDASDQVLGRLASKISTILQGKHKATYTPHVDTGDFIVLINAEKIRVTGKKGSVKEYDTYTRYPGGRHVYPYATMLAQHPEKVIELAVRRMLPKNKLARDMLGKLKIFKGSEHPHAAQQPKALKLL